MAAPTETDVLQRWCADVLERCNVHKAATIVAYNPATGRCTVTLDQVAQHADGTRGTPRMLSGLPVVVWSAAGFTVRADPQPGDRALLLIHDRALDGLELGPGQPVKSDRKHDTNDAIVLLGPSFVPLGPLLGMFVGRVDGTAGLAIDPAGATARLDATASVLLGGPAAVHPAVLGDQLQSALATFASTVQPAAATWAGASIDPAGAAFATVLQAALTTLQAALAGILSGKVVIE